MEFRQFLKDGVSWGELMFAMTAADHECDWSTIHILCVLHTLERNVKDSIFPDVTEQKMTLSEVQLHKKHMEHGMTVKPGKRGYWRVLISLDFRKWCWHFSQVNAGPTIQLLGELFGFTSEDTKAYQIAQQLFSAYARFTSLLPRSRLLS